MAHWAGAEAQRSLVTLTASGTTSVAASLKMVVPTWVQVTPSEVKSRLSLGHDGSVAGVTLADGRYT